MKLIWYEDTSVAEDINASMKLSASKNVNFKMSWYSTIPPNFWAAWYPYQDKIWASATYHDVFIILTVEWNSLVELSGWDMFAWTLIENQVARLEDAGY